MIHCCIDLQVFVQKLMLQKRRKTARNSRGCELYKHLNCVCLQYFKRKKCTHLLGPTYSQLTYLYMKTQGKQITQDIAD